MKKVVVWVIMCILILSIVMTGCNSNGENNKGEKNGNNATSTTLTEQTTSETETPGIETQETEDPMMDVYRADISGEWGENYVRENKENDEWRYTIYKNDMIGCAHVYQYKGTSRDIVVPDTFEGYPVTQILDPMLYNIMHYNADLRSFTKEYDISEVTSIQIPNTVYEVHSRMFHDTAWYENQPEGELYIGNVFYEYKGEMPQNTIFKIKDGTLGINELAFYKCEGLKELIMPDSVLWISDGAFRECSSLSTVQISKNILGMRQYVFDRVPNLKEIYLPKSLIFAFWALDDSSIQKIYFEGTYFEWLEISSSLALQRQFEVEYEVSLPY